jgi:hypothetical protein
VFVATLGHSRRCHVRAFRHERQESWFAGFESAFLAFGGIAEEVLMYNPRALVVRHDAVSRSVQFNDKMIAFAKHWGFAPRACAPFRARTKGKTESGVGYVKKNAITGHSFASWEVFEAHLAKWEREVANVRVHGTTGEAPIDRPEVGPRPGGVALDRQRGERAALRVLPTQIEAVLFAPEEPIRQEDGEARCPCIGRDPWPAGPQAGRAGSCAFGAGDEPGGLPVQTRRDGGF